MAENITENSIPSQSELPQLLTIRQNKLPDYIKKIMDTSGDGTVDDSEAVAYAKNFKKAAKQLDKDGIKTYSSWLEGIPEMPVGTKVVDFDGLKMSAKNFEVIMKGMKEGIKEITNDTTKPPEQTPTTPNSNKKTYLS